MTTDFTVIQAVRQRFGDEQAELGEGPVEQDAPFVGTSKDFPFSCPNVVRRAMAVLHFQSLGVTVRNVLRINGIDIPGGITPGPQDPRTRDGLRAPIWSTHSLLVPENVLTIENVLSIESVLTPFAHEVTHDNFIIDNIVVFFKVGEGRRPPRHTGPIHPIDPIDSA